MISFDKLDEVAVRMGIEVLPLQDDPQKTPTAVVSQAGEPIPGSDIIRKMLLAPIIREGYLVWMYAEPKAGKTWLGLAIAYAIASRNGMVGKWSSPDPHGVLLVDGEMLPDELSAWVNIVMRGAGDFSEAPPFARICGKAQPDGFIDLLEERWQQEIENQLHGKSLLILDNFQSLTDNGISRLRELQPWLRRITARRIAVLVLDHTNREGELQGSAAKLRTANLVIEMTHPDELAKRMGRVLIRFPFARTIHGAEAEPFILERRFSQDGSSMTFVEIAPSNPPAPEKTERITRMAQVVFAKNDQGMTFNQIESLNGIRRSTAHDLLKGSQKLQGPKAAAFEAELQRLRLKSSGTNP